MVERAHGTMDVPEEKAMPISGDHLSLCRFGNHVTEKDRFMVVSQGMKKMIDDSPRQTSALD